MATLKQTIANRLNSLKSTGPKSPEGRLVASTNATKHGLSRLGVLPPSALAGEIADRKRNWRSEYRPVGPAQEWHFERFCAESVRLDACEHRLIVARAGLAERAGESWDDDRAADIAALAARLADRPEVIQSKLLTSKHGVRWLLERWDEVADSLTRHDGWTPEAWGRAMDLLGLPADARDGSGPWDLDPADKTAAPGLELVRRSVEALRHRLESYLDARDARDREDAEAGLSAVDTPEIRRLERYAADARRRAASSLAELRRLQGQAGRAPSARPVPIVAGPPGPRPDRSARRSNPTAPGLAAASPPPPPPNPSPAATTTAPVSNPSPTPNPSPTRNPLPSTSLRDRLINLQGPTNRRARRAQAAAARRS